MDMPIRHHMRPLVLASFLGIAAMLAAEAAIAKQVCRPQSIIEKVCTPVQHTCDKKGICRPVVQTCTTKTVTTQRCQGNGKK